MENASLLHGTRIVLVVGIVLILIGVIVPNDWAIDRLCREAGVVVTLMGMVATIAQRQAVDDTQRRLLSTSQPPTEHREGHAGETTSHATAA
ncbi:MAG: hypothetical protein FJ147_27550 [Deltaproteobacteria bacterium]|nr:hypothetical protein [Deltaproteobacteria bacterium]